jgi:cell wall-associated NlpC family hydrolase
VSIRLPLLVGLCLALVTGDCRLDASTQHGPSLAVPDGLQAGDLVFREGTELISAAVMRVDSGGYSHVGLLIGEPGHWRIVHAVPAERSDRGNEVVIDDLTFFLAPERTRNAAFYRVDADPETRRNAVAFAMQQQGVPFRIGSEQGTYCTRLIDESYLHAGLSLQVRYQYLHIPLLQGEYLLPSALRTSPRLSLIYATGRM